MTGYRSKWAGRVYDGPLEGEYHAIDRPFFEFNFMPGQNLSSIGIDMLMSADSCPYYYRMLYRWSNPLRAWVFDWRSAPPARKGNGRPARSGRKPVDVRKFTSSKGWDIC